MTKPQQSVQRAQQQPVEREALGRLVRRAWLAWAREQPDVAAHPGWLAPWEALTEREREVDRRIADALVENPPLLTSLALAVADASLAVLDAQEKQTGVWEQSPAAMVHHGDRWLGEAKSAKEAVDDAAAQLQVATLALRAARAVEGKP